MNDSMTLISANKPWACCYFQTAPLGHFGPCFTRHFGQIDCSKLIMIPFQDEGDEREKPLISLFADEPEEAPKNELKQFQSLDKDILGLDLIFLFLVMNPKNTQHQEQLRHHQHMVVVQFLLFLPRFFLEMKVRRGRHTMKKQVNHLTTKAQSPNHKPSTLTGVVSNCLPKQIL